VADQFSELYCLFCRMAGNEERSRSAAGSNSFYFLEPPHHVGRLKSKYPPSGSAVLKQHDLKKTAEMNESFERRKDRHWLLTV